MCNYSARPWCRPTYNGRRWQHCSPPRRPWSEYSYSSKAACTQGKYESDKQGIDGLYSQNFWNTCFYFSQMHFLFHIHITEYNIARPVTVDTTPKPGQAGLEKCGVHRKGKALSPATLHPRGKSFLLVPGTGWWAQNTQRLKAWGEWGEGGGWLLCRQGLRKQVLLGMGGRRPSTQQLGAVWVQVGRGSRSPQALNTSGPQSSELWQESQVVSWHYQSHPLVLIATLPATYLLGVFHVRV